MSCRARKQMGMAHDARNGRSTHIPIPGRHGRGFRPKKKGRRLSRRPVLRFAIMQSRSIARERRCRPRAQTSRQDTGRPCPSSSLAFRPCFSSAHRRPSSAAPREVPCPVATPAAEAARRPPQVAAGRSLEVRRRRAAPSSSACLLSSALAPAPLPAAAEPLPQLEEEAQLPRLEEAAVEVRPSPRLGAAAAVQAPRLEAELFPLAAAELSPQPGEAVVALTPRQAAVAALPF